MGLRAGGLERGAKMKKQCLECGVEFNAKPCKVRRGAGKYCSHKCQRSHWCKNPELNPGWNDGVSRDEYWKRLYHRLSGIQQRCHNPKHEKYPRYGARGIKCLITYSELKILWIRDKADLLKDPTVDRIDNDGDYIFYNLRFIEKSENTKRMLAERWKHKNKGEKEDGRQITDGR